MKLLNRDYHSAIKALRLNKDFKIFLAHYYDNEFYTSALTENDAIKVGGRIGRQDLIREMIDSVYQAEKEQITELINEYNVSENEER